MKQVLFESILKNKHVMEDDFIKKVFLIEKATAVVFWSFFLLIKIYWSIARLWLKTATLRGISTNSDGWKD